MLNCKLLWAKSNPYKPLIKHMLETGIIAQKIIANSIYRSDLYMLCEWLNMCEEEVIASVGYICALHDIGKAHPAFQCKALECMDLDKEEKEFITNYDAISNQHFRHEKYSAIVFLRLAEQRYGKSMRQSARNISAILELHHQGKTGEAHEVKIDRWQDMQDSLEDQIFNYFQPSTILIDKKHCSNITGVCTIILGILIMSDWIASGEGFEGNMTIEECKQYAQEFVNKAGMKVQPPLSITQFIDLWVEIPGDGLRPLQKNINDYFLNQVNKEHPPLAMIIEAPMGEGKTEAGIYAAFCLAKIWKKQGIYIGLPTSATSNQMYSRFNALLEEHQLQESKLLHAMAWMMDDEYYTDSIQTEDEQYAKNWTKPIKRGLLLPYAVGTIDQVMMAALDIRYGVLRLLGLSSKVLILDEIHAYDAYMGDIIIKLLKWCRALQIPVVMLSATLPSEKKQEIMAVYDSEQSNSLAYPAVTCIGKKTEILAVDGSYMHGEYQLECVKGLNNPSIIATLAKERVKDGGCLCIIMNTVKSARAVFSEIKRNNDIPCYLFMARTTAKKRKEMEEICIRLFGKDKSHRPSQAILVATQVVEQSLDLDFDTMFTAIAPIDLLLQRLGRVHRHEDTQRPQTMQQPKVTVLIPEEGEDYQSNSIIYPEILLKQTQSCVENQSCVKIPEDLPTMVEAVYSDAGIPEEYYTKWMDNEMEKGMMRNMARQCELNEPDKRRFSLKYADNVFLSDEENQGNYMNAQTRMGNESIQIAIIDTAMYDAIKQGKLIGKKDAKTIMSNSLSVYQTILKNYMDRPTVEGRKIIEGNGLLKFTKLIPMEGGCCTFDDGTYLKLDEDYGFISSEDRVE